MEKYFGADAAEMDKKVVVHALKCASTPGEQTAAPAGIAAHLAAAYVALYPVGTDG